MAAGVVAALAVGVLSATGATVLARGSVDELDRRVGTLTAEAGQLTSRIETLTTQNETLTTEKEALAAEVTGAHARVEELTRQNAELHSQLEGLAPAEPVAATVAYEGVLAEGKWFTPGPAFLLVVDVTVHNPDAEQVAYFSTYDFRLKGPDDTVYPILEQSPVAGQPRFLGGVSDLPGGRIQVQSQQLAPSETVKGSLVFYVSRRVETFTMTYHGETTTLSP